MKGKYNQKTTLIVVLTLILIVIGLKGIPLFLQVVSQQSDLMNKPALIFFNVDDPCDCMIELTQKADLQMETWQNENQSKLPVIRVAMDNRQDLEAKYQVFRAPSLVLVDADDQIVWRQDYPLIEGGLFKLDELNNAIENLESE